MAKQQVKSLQDLMTEKVQGAQPVNEVQAKKNAEIGVAAAPKTGLEAVIEARSGETIEELTKDDSKVKIEEPEPIRPVKAKEKKEEKEPEEPKEEVKELPWKSKFNKPKEEKTEIVEGKVVETPKPLHDDETIKAANEYKKYKDDIELLNNIRKSGGLTKHISEIISKNPEGKTSEQLLKDSVRRSLEGYFGKDSEEITQDVIDNEIDSMSLIAKARASQEERNLQIQEYQQGISTIQSPAEKRAESTAKEGDDYLNNLSGKEVHSLIVTPDRYEKLKAEIEAYSEGKKEFTGEKFVNSIFFDLFADEIKDTVLEKYGNTKIEEAVAKVKGSEKRVSATRTADTGAAVMSAEEQNAIAAKETFLAPVREQITKLAERQRV